MLATLILNELKFINHTRIISMSPIYQMPDITHLPASTKALSLYLRRVACEDETEHEGIWPFVGEGMANDAIRLSALITTQTGARGKGIQARTPVIDLGSNYQDRTVCRFGHRLMCVPLSSETQFPLTVNASLVLIEEDWGGQMDEVTEKVLTEIGDFVKSKVAQATTTAVAAGIGGAIGSALGPLGTTVGAGLGAAVGFIVQQIGAALDSLKSDAFPPQDLSIVMADANARFRTGNEHHQTAIFEGFGGKYKLQLTWRLANVDRRVALRASNGSYLMAHGGGGAFVEAVSKQTRPKSWETFIMEDVAANRIALRAHKGQSLGPDENGRLTANQQVVTVKQVLRVVRLGGGKVAIQNHSGKYLSVERGEGGQLRFNSSRVSQAETFSLEVM